MDRAFWFYGFFFWGSVIFKMCYFFPRKQAWSSWNLVPQSCVMNASLSFILSSFSKWGQLCFCQHSWFWNKFQLLQACLLGKSGTFWKWHCLRIIALESKCLVHTLWTWCQITWKKIQWYSIKNVVEITDQNLHSFWATPYLRYFKSIPRISINCSMLYSLFICNIQTNIITDTSWAGDKLFHMVILCLWPRNKEWW